MAIKIIWTHKAQTDRLNILKYWIDRNKSNLFSIKLNEIFDDRIEILAEYPKVGKRTEIKDVLYLIVKDYYVFYKIIENKLIILSIFDSRQNPKKIRKIVKK